MGLVFGHKKGLIPKVLKGLIVGFRKTRLTRGDVGKAASQGPK